jgi:formylglycine-generating enzyme required for sulfatase activity
MAGNVFELTAKDVSIEKAWNSVPTIYRHVPKEPSEKTDFRVIRGGCTGLARKYFRCAARSVTFFHFHTYEYGFRVVAPIPV